MTTIWKKILCWICRNFGHKHPKSIAVKIKFTCERCGKEVDLTKTYKE